MECNCINLSFITVGHPPIITTHPMNKNVLLRYGDESAEFSCKANGGDDIQYSWFAETSNGSKIMVGGSSNELVLSPVTIAMNNTQYYCVASNNSGDVTSKKARLIVDYAIGK